MNITLTGFMGTGKTVVGRRLAKQLGWRFVNVDDVIEASAKKPVPKIFTEHGEQVFRRLEHRAILTITRDDEQVIATGGGAFANPFNRQVLRAVGPTVCLTAQPKVILQRVTPTLASRPLLANTSGAETLKRVEQLMAQRACAYAKADLTIETSRLSVDDVVEAVYEALNPWISKSWCYLLKHSDRLAQRYGGQYIAVLDDRIVAVGPTQLETYQRIRPRVPAECEVGIYYIPLPEESAISR